MGSYFGDLVRESRYILEGYANRGKKRKRKDVEERPEVNVGEEPLPARGNEYVDRGYRTTLANVHSQTTHT